MQTPQIIKLRGYTILKGNLTPVKNYHQLVTIRKELLQVILWILKNSFMDKAVRQLLR